MECILGIIGGGNMAEAILRGVVGSGFLPPQSVIVSDPVPARRELLARETQVNVTFDNFQPAACQRVLLAIKPQMIGEVLGQIAQRVHQDATVVSIAAGVPTSRLDALLQRRGHIVRVMPNTPMLVGAGMSAIAAGPRAVHDDIDFALRLFAASGRTVEVPENLIDAVTAVSGSGPAYFFYLIEAMVAAGQAEGLDAQTATLLAIQTCAGAARLLEKSGESPQALRQAVTSPAGTTQKAIEVMEAAGVKHSLIQAIRAAAARSRELGKAQ